MSETKRLDFLYIEENALSGTTPPQFGNLEVTSTQFCPDASRCIGCLPRHRLESAVCP